MLTNYLKVALRTLRKKPFYTAINILGLAIGMAACLLIPLYVLDELSYDRFHERADRIYRVTTRTAFAEQESRMASTNYHIGEVMDDEIPEVEQTVRVQQEWKQLIKHDGNRYPDYIMLATDSTFFGVFTFPMREGDSRTALQAPNSIVVTVNLAETVFGRSKGVVGSTLMVGDRLRKVTGVVDNPPPNAHFHFDMLAPIEPRVTDKISWFNVKRSVRPGLRWWANF